MIRERDFAIWKPVHSAYYACQQPTANMTTIELNMRTKVAIVTANGVSTIKALTCRDGLLLAKFYRDKVGYRLEWLTSDVILLTKKTARTVSTLQGLKAA